MKQTKREIRLSNLNSVNRILKYAILYIALTLLILILQIMFIYYASKNGLEMDAVTTVVSFGTFVFGFIFILTQVFEIIKCRRLIKEVRSNGVIDDCNILYILAQKNTLGTAVKFLQYVMLLITIVMSFGFGTYSVFDFAYNGNINLYLPIIIMLCVSTSFSIKYIECLTDI